MSNSAVPLTLPYLMEATKQALFNEKKRPAYSTAYQMDFILTDDFEEGLYKTDCCCSWHNCKRKFDRIRASHKMRIKIRMERLIKQDKLLKQWLSSASK